MNVTVKGPSYLMRWDHSRDQRLGRDVVQTTHRLAELPIFSDEGLAELLDQYPREAIQVSTTGKNPTYPSQLRIGQLGDHSGAELIAMLRRGRLCLRLKSLGEHHQGMREIVGRLCGEMMECQGLHTLHHEGELEICSPQTLVYYHCDLDPNICWQVRGCRSIWVYPSREPYLLTRPLERMLAGERATHLYYEPAFDDSAKRYVQTGGDAFAVPQQTPYRVVNDQHLSVTLITRYITAESRRRNETHLANHTLMKYLPSVMLADGRHGVRAALKRTLARLAGAQRRDASFEPKPPTFRVDPQAPNCIGALDTDITEYHMSETVVPKIDPPITATAAVTTEN
jgi:hypothetical protein